MALLTPDDKLKQNAGQDPAQGAQPAASGAPSGQAAGSAFSTGADSAGSAQGAPGTGGNNGWTNIQAYLSANRGDTFTGQALQKQVDGAFDQERSTFDQDASQARTAAQGQLDHSLTQDQASQLLDQAAPQYSYSGPQAAGYHSIVSQLQGGLQGYQGNRSYSYGMGADAQRYGQDLQSDDGMKGLLQGVYDQNAGGQMTSGGLALQQQLDNNNPGLQQTERSLLNHYVDLRSREATGMDDTNQFVKTAADTVDQNRDHLQTYLGGEAAGSRKNLDQTVTSTNQWIGSQADEARNRILPTLNAGFGNLNPAVPYNIDALSKANESNVADPNRSRWNTIQDILGGQDKISQDASLLTDPSSLQYSLRHGGEGWHQDGSEKDLVDWLNANPISFGQSGAPPIPTPVTPAVTTAPAATSPVRAPVPVNTGHSPLGPNRANTPTPPPAPPVDFYTALTQHQPYQFGNFSLL